MVKFIGISKIWYGPTMTTAPSASSLKTLLTGGTLTEVTNSHEGTWGYSQEDPNTTDYINELTGKPYHRDKVSDGKKIITWTSGEYDYADKAALQGGSTVTESSTVVGYAGGSADFINKCVIAKTKTGNYIVFTNADIVAKADTQERAIGLGVTATALENPNSTVSSPIADEYWFSGSAVDTV